MSLTVTRPTTLKARLDADEPVFLLDVREGWEFEHGHLAGAHHIPMGEITSRLDELPEDRPVVCICHHGMRSEQVARYLLQQGRSGVENLQGGMDAWSVEVDPAIPRY